MGSFKKNTVSTRTTSESSENLSYMPGFGNDFETESSSWRTTAGTK